MFCQDCGAPNDDANLHCTECGRLLAPRMRGADGSVRSGSNPATDTGRTSTPPSPGPAYGEPPPRRNAMQPYGTSPYPMQYQQKSRVAAGVLQLLLPLGIGRLYMGYTGIGIAQFLTAIFCGVGVLWAFVDGILILTGNPPTDGNGVPMKD